MIATVFLLVGVLQALAAEPPCVEGLKLDCAYVAAAASYADEPTARAARRLRGLARRGHVGARVLLLTEVDDAATPEDRIRVFRKLADRGIASGFEQYGMAVASFPGSERQAGELLMGAIRRGPGEAMRMIALGNLGNDELSELDRLISRYAAVAACVMGSHVGCYGAAYELWDPNSASHAPELARWLAERALGQGDLPETKTLLALMLLAEPDPDYDRVVSLLEPLAETGNTNAMYHLSRALLERRAEGDVGRGLAWLDSAVRAGHVDAAESLCRMVAGGVSSVNGELPSPESWERAMALLRQERPEVYSLYGGGQERVQGSREAMLEASPAAGPLYAALEAARGGRLESLRALAALVEASTSDIGAPAELLSQVEEALCAVGPAGIPSYLWMVRILRGEMDTVTQAAWLFLVPHRVASESVAAEEYSVVRTLIWSELTGAELLVAEARAVELRQQIASTRPRCALVR